MYVLRNTEALSRNHCCSEKAVSKILCVSVALVIQKEMRMRHIFMCPVWLYCIFHINS
jgi:hypothetical protein